MSLLLSNSVCNQFIKVIDANSEKCQSLFYFKISHIYIFLLSLGDTRFHLSRKTVLFFRFIPHLEI